MTTTITGHDAIAIAEARGLTLGKYADPTESALEALSVAEAREIAAEDPGLIWVDVPWVAGDRVQGGEGEDYDYGEIVELSGDRALVAWRGSETMAWAPLSGMERA